MSKQMIAGIATLYCDLKVSMDEMRDWEPERITAFFDGIAKVKEAIRGPRVLVPRPIHVPVADDQICKCDNPRPTPVNDDQFCASCGYTIRAELDERPQEAVTK